MLVAGIDGTRRGWVVVTYADGVTAAFGAATINEALQRLEAASYVAVDMLIGFLDAAVPGGRECERLGRRMLGRRASSIFSSPCRAALACPDHPSASRTNRESSPHGLGLSRQAHAIFPKMREIDAIVTPDLQERLFEIHPELCFVEMALIENVEAPAGKKTSAGVEQRMALLEAVGFAASSLCDHRRSWGASRDDVLDAAAAAWTALRRAQGLARFLPHTPPTDARGLRMEMWI